MKKFMVVAIMTFVMIGMTSCKKDDLSGTKWTASYSETIEELGGMTLTVNLTLEFTTEKDGTLTMSMPEFGMNEVDTFTYTFDGKEGTMTGKDENGVESSIPFTVDGDKLTMTDKDEETGEPISIEFTKSK